MWLEEDIIDVTEAGINNSKIQSFSLILCHGEEETELENIRQLTISSNFITNVSDIITFDCLYGYGDFVYDILPYKSDLYVNLLVEYQDAKGETQTFTKWLSCFLTNKDLSSKTNEKLLMSREDLNKEQPLVLKFTCYDLIATTLKKVPSTMMLKGVKVEHALKANFSYYVKKAQVKIDGEDVKMSVDIVEPDNTTKLAHIVVDQGPNTNLDLTTIPFYLQDKFGVYNSGIVSYFQDYGEPKVFIRPQLDPRMYDNDVCKSLDILISNDKKEASALESSYADIGGILKIVSPDIKGLFDDGENRLENDGRAIVYRDNEMTRRAVKVTISDKVVKNEDTNYSKLDFKLQTARGLTRKPTKIKMLGSKSNMYAERSKLFLSEARLVPVKWPQSCHFIIEPSMPTVVHYEDNEDGLGNVVKKYPGNVAIINTLFTFRNDEVTSSSELIVMLLDDLSEEDDKKASGEA